MRIRPLLAAIVALAAPLGAQGAAPPADRVPPHDTFTVASRALGEPRPINVYTPPGYRASGDARYPVLYMPDGGIVDEDFSHVVNTVDSLIARREIPPMLVVGIPNTQRRRDLTGPTRIHQDSAIAPRVGGSAAFRRFLREELVPAVDARYRTTAERAIVGESLAGLFVVETFVKDPTLFSRYVAFDPSLWWDRGSLVDSAAARLTTLDATPRTLYLAASRDGIDSLTTRLAGRLQAASLRGLTWQYEPRPDLTHATIFRAAGPAALARALRAPAAAAPAPAPAPDGVMLTFERFADIFGSRLVAAFDSIPAARYGYRPTPVQQTVGYIAQHLEDANYSLCERFGALEHPRTAKDSLPDTVKARWPKDTLVARLRASLRFCDEALEGAGPLQSAALASSLLAFETDLAEHYSQISSYMRLLGLVPPSALPPRQRTAIELPAASLSPYVGVYQIAPGLELTVTMQNGALFVRSTTGGGAVRLWPESGTDFFVKEADAQVSFTRDASGGVTGLVLHQFGRDRPARKIQ